MMTSPPRRQQGVALLTAIVLVALGTILATAIAFQTGMTARRVASTLAFDQSLLVAEAGEALAAYALREDLRSSQSRIDFPGERWGMPFGPVEVVPGVTLQAQVEDLSGRFNLNSLVVEGPDRTSVPNPKAIAIFERLLESRGIEPEWATKIADWIDSDANPGSGGAEDETYTAQDPSYRTPNLPISSVSELLALPEFGRERYRELADLVVALPPDAKVNVCSANAYLLDAMQNEVQWVNDTELPEKREMECFPRQSAYEAGLGRLKADEKQDVVQRLSENSNYFRLTSVVTIGTAQFALYSLLYRDSGGNVRPILRSFTAD